MTNNKATTTLFTKIGCHGCVVAKELLHQSNVLYEAIELENVNSLRQKTMNSEAVFPWIVHHGKVIPSVEKLQEVLQEDALIPNPSRFTIYPIRYEDMWQMYKKAVASFWTAEEIDLSKDKADWDGLKDDERHFLKHVLAFFASADGIVNENLAQNFMHEVQIPEARQFYSYQVYNEAIHSETYSMLIDSYITDPIEKDQVFNAILTMPCVQKKAQWAQKWTHQNRRFAERLIAFICVEGILFSGSFCAIFWMKKRGLLPGLSFSNELIARDEGLHMEFGILLYRHIKNKLSRDEVLAIIQEAVDNEKDFIRKALPCRLIGMNSKLMGNYIEFVADRILKELGYAPAFHASNPFDFMERISLSGKTNFFEKRVGEYAKAGVATRNNEFKFTLTEEF